MAVTAESNVLTVLEHSFNTRIPKGRDLAAAAMAEALAGHEGDAGWLRSNFSRLVEEVQVEAYRKYLGAEREVSQAAFSEAFLPLVKPNATPEEFVQFIGDNFYALDRYFLKLTQGRKARAGGAFELLIHRLLVLLQYPFTPQPVIDGQPDFILPSVEHYRCNPMDTIIFTLKRTLRERWRQIVTEGTRGLGFYLGTIDEKITERDLKDMLASRIHVVVPMRIKALCKHYEAAPNVITFEHFLEFHLDPAMQRWKASGII